MSDPGLLVLGPAIDADESAHSLANLVRVDLPGATKFVVTRGKFPTDGPVKTFNIDTGYPAEIAELRTLATFAGHDFRQDPRFRDGYDLFCIRRLLERNGGFDRLLLLRDPDGFEAHWPGVQASAADRLFATDPDGRNLLLNLADPSSRAMIEMAWALYHSGAAYSLHPYGLAGALTAASEAVEFVASLNPMATI